MVHLSSLRVFEIISLIEQRIGDLGINELAPGDLLLDQFTVGREFHFHFDLLETAIVADQSFVDEVDCVVAVIVQAEIVIEVDAAFDDLSAAVAFYVEDVIAFLGLGGTPLE